MKLPTKGPHPQPDFFDGFQRELWPGRVDASEREERRRVVVTARVLASSLPSPFSRLARVMGEHVAGGRRSRPR